jgi:transposase
VPCTVLLRSGLEQICKRLGRRAAPEAALDRADLLPASLTFLSFADRYGLPLAACAASASPHEVTLVAPTLDSRFADEPPRRSIGDRGYDADRLDAQLAHLGIEMIAPHRRNRTRPKTQDGRLLRRYRRRWNMELLFAWLQNFRRIVVRYERYALNYLGFVHISCILILLRLGL